MKYDREKIYLALPVPLQHAMCSLEGWRIKKRRYGKAFHTLLRTYEARAFWSDGRVRNYRDRRISEFVKHCQMSVPYYRDEFRKLGISSKEIQTLDDLRELPVLTKQTVQERYAEFLSESVSEKDRVIAHTSGSTGAGLRFATTAQSQSEQWALWWRYRRCHGITTDTWCGYFGGRSVVPMLQCRPPFWRYNVPGCQILFSGYHMSPKNMGDYVRELARRRPPWLHGYPSLLALLASYILEKGRGTGYPIRWITTGAENLLPQQVLLIERAFGVRPRQHYGSAEAVANISECQHGRLHVDEDFSAVEFLSEPAKEGHRIIGTNFTNPATPLLRYDTGDVATLSDETCPCGRPGRIVQRIDGRQEDYVVLKNGVHIGRMDHIFKDMVHIREAQLHQPAAGRIDIRVVCGGGYTQEDEKSLLAEFRKRVGANTVLNIQYVDRVARSRTGKLRFVVSDIPGEQRNGALAGSLQKAAGL